MEALYTKNILGFTDKTTRSDSANRTLLFSDLPNYKHVLLLQGPVGPFFKNLACYWRNRGAAVTKINFNSGDDLFFPATSGSVIQYKARMEFWPQYLSSLLSDRNIRAVFLFGDCREIHQPVRALCELLGIDLWVLEEGYIRPHLFTLEKGGVNHHSNLTNLNLNTLCGARESQDEAPIKKNFDSSFWYMVRWAIFYWLANMINRNHYPDYTHHRILNLSMGIKWSKSLYRYWVFRFSEKFLRDRLLKQSMDNSKSRLFLLPLQVHDDSQIVVHSDFSSIEQVIEAVVSSFSAHLKEGHEKDILVIKHHPMDRGHTNFSQFIKDLSKVYQIEKQIIYIHDISVPDLLKKVSGCITVNSTIGLQALYRGVPTINLGKSFYDMPGLTYQGPLEEFWNSFDKVDIKTIKSFRNYLLHHTQVNGSLYDPAYLIE